MAVPVEGRYGHRGLGLRPPEDHRARPPRRCGRRRSGRQGGGVPRAPAVARDPAQGLAAASALSGVHRARRLALWVRERGDRERLVRRYCPVAGKRAALRPARAVRRLVRRQRRAGLRRAIRVRLRGSRGLDRARRVAAPWLAARCRRRGRRPRRRGRQSRYPKPRPDRRCRRRTGRRPIHLAGRGRPPSQAPYCAPGILARVRPRGRGTLAAEQGFAGVGSPPGRCASARSSGGAAGNVQVLLRAAPATPADEAAEASRHE